MPGNSPVWNNSHLKVVATNGIQMAVHATGFGEGHRLPVLFLHGFPELAFSWRHQLSALHAAGFGVAAPDLRGFGDTGVHGEIEEYRMANLALDVIGLLDGMGVERAVVVGHDFGGRLAWTLAREHPHRVMGVASLNTAYSPRTDADTVEMRRRSHGPTHYMTTFQTPGIGEKLLSADIPATFSGLMRRPAVTLDEFSCLPERLRALPATLFTGEPEVMGEPLLNAEEIDVFVQAYKKTGFTGALNWYRNLRRDWFDREGQSDHVPVPALMVSATDDFFLPPDTTQGMEQYVPDLERRLIGDCGHWTQQERPEAVNSLLLDWLRRRMLPLWTADGSPSSRIGSPDPGQARRLWAGQN